MGALFQDVKYGLRMLSKNPGFSIVAVLTLALGIGANTAIFSVVNAVVLQPLPYPDPSRLAILWSSFTKAHQSRVPSSGPEWAELRRRSRLFQDVAGVWLSSGNLTGNGEPEQLKVGFVTFNFFSTLGVSPALGRSFLAEEQGSTAPTMIILSDGFWRRRYGADPGIIGKAIQFEGSPFTVVGIMPRDFQVIFPSDANVPSDIQVWAPFHSDLPKDPRDVGYLRMVGRLRPGVTAQQAQAETGAIATELRSQFAEYADEGLDVEVVPLQQDAIREVRPSLLALFAGVGLVLLIACVNVANLLLARAGIRRREITVRGALGASRARIIRQLLTESLLLAGLGAAGGLFLASWGLHWIMSLRPASLARTHASFDWSVLGFTVAVSAASGILFGLAPAVELFKLDYMEALKDGGRTSTPGKRRGSLLLVASEMTLGFVLLIGAGLMIRTFTHLQHVDGGFNPDHVLTFQIALPFGRYPTEKARAQFFTQLGKNLASVPGAQAVGASSYLPLDDAPNWYSYYWRDGAPAAEQNTTLADHRAILPGFFNSLGVPLVEGRNFNDFDDSTHPRVAIVDESLARRTWPGESALGKKLNVEVFNNWQFVRGAVEVVGVAKHVRFQDLRHEIRGQAYFPYPQSARPQLAFTVRTAANPLALVEPVRLEVEKLDKDIPLYKVRTMDAYVTQAMSATRFTALLATVFAAVALLLASIGIYGVTSYAVGRRTQEIGVRLALGAQRRDILKLILGQGIILTAMGVGAGLLAALLATRFLASLLFGVKPTDPLTYLIVSVVLTGVALLACYIPARRATKVDPMVALRYE